MKKAVAERKHRHETNSFVQLVDEGGLTLPDVRPAPAEGRTGLPWNKTFGPAGECAAEGTQHTSGRLGQTEDEATA